MSEPKTVYDILREKQPCCSECNCSIRYAFVEERQPYVVSMLGSGKVPEKCDPCHYKELYLVTSDLKYKDKIAFYLLRRYRISVSTSLESAVPTPIQTVVDADDADDDSSDESPRNYRYSPGPDERRELVWPEEEHDA